MVSCNPKSHISYPHFKEMVHEKYFLTFLLQYQVVLFAQVSQTLLYHNGQLESKESAYLYCSQH